MKILSNDDIDQVGAGISANYVIPLSGAIDMAVFTWAGAAFTFGYLIGTELNTYFRLSDRLIKYLPQ
jgi:hypothetical protein